MIYFITVTKAWRNRVNIHGFRWAFLLTFYIYSSNILSALIIYYKLKGGRHVSNKKDTDRVCGSDNKSD